MHQFTPEELACLAGTRSYAQYHQMRANFEAKHCIFCHLDKIMNVVLWEDEYFRVWDTPEEFKRDYLAVQLMVVPKRHVRFPWDLNEQERASQHQAELFAAQHSDLPGGMWFVRFGDMRLNAGTVPHLHWNLWVPKRGASVLVPISNGTEAQARKDARAAGFAARYEAGEVP